MSEILDLAFTALLLFLFLGPTIIGGILEGRYTDRTRQ